MIKKEEVWKSIAGYEDHYAVSSHGRVMKKKNGRILKIKQPESGYMMASLNVDGIQKVFSVHRLVAKAFLTNPKNLKVVNHIDSNKFNNNADNLEWCTHSQNTLHWMNGKNPKFVKEWWDDTDAFKKAKDVFNSTVGENMTRKEKFNEFIRWFLKQIPK